MESERKMGVFKVAQYEFMRELDKDDENYPAFEMIRIRVKSLINAPTMEFSAIPEKEGFMQLIQANNEFVGKGQTEEEAVNNCVEKIKNVPTSEIFPKRENKIEEGSV